jgi:hypothetical protein
MSVSVKCNKYVEKSTNVVLGSKNLERGLNDTSSESEDEVEGGLLLDVWLLVSCPVTFLPVLLPPPR